MNDTIPTNPVSAHKANELVKELWCEMMRIGYEGWGKNDLFDYLLYLFNKYDEKHFFDSNSNEKK